MRESDTQRIRHLALQNLPSSRGGGEASTNSDISFTNKLANKINHLDKRWQTVTQRRQKALGQSSPALSDEFWIDKFTKAERSPTEIVCNSIPFGTKEVIILITQLTPTLYDTHAHRHCIIDKILLYSHENFLGKCQTKWIEILTSHTNELELMLKIKLKKQQQLNNLTKSMRTLTTFRVESILHQIPFTVQNTKRLKLTFKSLLHSLQLKSSFDLHMVPILLPDSTFLQEGDFSTPYTLNHKGDIVPPGHHLGCKTLR